MAYKIIALSMPPKFFSIAKFPNRSEDIKHKVTYFLKTYPEIAELYKQKAVMSTISISDELYSILEAFGKFRSEIIRLAYLMPEIEKILTIKNVA